MKVECPYRKECIDVGERCRVCLNNRKRSYYKPMYLGESSTYSPDTTATGVNTPWTFIYSN